MKMAVFLGAAKYVVGLLWHSSIWNFLMKNKEKNQAHEELTKTYHVVRNKCPLSKINTSTFENQIVDDKKSQQMSTVSSFM